MDGLFGASVETLDRVTIVHLCGEVDLGGKARLAECLGETSGRVIVDLSGVTFLDSSALGVLANTDRRLGEAGGTLSVRSPTPAVRRVLEITGLDGWIELGGGPRGCSVATS